MDYGLFDFLTLLGSLGLFLYGMNVMSDALMEQAGDRMRNILATATSNRLFAVLTGFIITAVIQSSSAITLMVVSFANASLLGFKVNMAAIAIKIARNLVDVSSLLYLQRDHFHDTDEKKVLAAAA